MAWIEPNPKKHPGHRGPWNVRYRENGEKRWSGPFWNVSEARDEEAARTKQEREARRHVHGHGAAGSSLKQLWQDYKTEAVNEGVLRESTAYQKDRMLGPYLERFPALRDLTGTWGSKDWGQAIQALKTELLTKPSPASVARAKRLRDDSLLRPYSSTTASIILRALQTFLEWCKTKKHLPANPMEDFDMPRSRERKDKLRTRDDIGTVLAAAPTPEFRLFLVFQVYQGLRRSMTILTEGHHIRDGMWTVPAENTKEDYDVTVPLHPRVQEELAAIYPKGLPNGRLFPFTYSQVTWYWNQTRKAAALPYHITIHGLRRTWATAFMEHTQNLKALMAAGAWRDAKTAMKYQHLQAKWLKEQVQDFDYE